MALYLVVVDVGLLPVLTWVVMKSELIWDRVVGTGIRLRLYLHRMRIYALAIDGRSCSSWNPLEF